MAGIPGFRLGAPRFSIAKVRNFRYYIRVVEKIAMAKKPPVIQQVSKLTRKGQTTVPKSIRQALGVSFGDRIAYLLAKDGSVTVQALSRTDAQADPPSSDAKAQCRQSFADLLLSFPDVGDVARDASPPRDLGL